ncbi:MAG: Unknown protein [uncultured Sulfurovum sp.]|uniref:Uncharacterized protein n=1 Tax=uncultured Sulfurovum sp. TaxID=269237 RepID=A0A6S6U779_9BACT|nr:MAG: Unknown protein [uncultured Sulfurovum sp.]
MTNTLKLVLATVVGVTLTIGSLSATETVEKVDAFKNISTQAVSVEESNLLAGKLTREQRKARREHCKDVPSGYTGGSMCERGFLGIGFRNN